MLYARRRRTDDTVPRPGDTGSPRDALSLSIKPPRHRHRLADPSHEEESRWRQEVERDRKLSKKRKSGGMRMAMGRSKGRAYRYMERASAEYRSMWG